MPAPPFGATENAEPATAWAGSRFSDQVAVTVTPSEATLAAVIEGALVSKVKLRVAVAASVLPSLSIVSTVVAYVSPSVSEPAASA